MVLLNMIRHGEPPYLECSSKGEKLLSAFYARIRKRQNRSIEDLYQASKIFEDGSTGLGWREAKGRKPVNMDESRAFYAQLWDEYIAENPDLLELIRSASGLSDVFGKNGSCCQATELWRIRNMTDVLHQDNKIVYHEGDRVDVALGGDTSKIITGTIVGFSSSGIIDHWIIKLDAMISDWEFSCITQQHTFIRPSGDNRSFLCEGI